MNEQWQELKETIIEMRDNDGIGTQQEVCKFLANLMDVLEKQIIDEWIPVSDRLPEKPYGCIVTVMDTNPMTCDEFENIYPDFVGWDGENWNDADGYSIPFEVIAWMPLPQPYKEESESDVQ